jgi:hypothetical protein
LQCWHSLAFHFDEVPPQYESAANSVCSFLPKGQRNNYSINNMFIFSEIDYKISLTLSFPRLIDV